MARSTIINPYQQFHDTDAITPLSGGSITVYENETTTLASIYSDPDLTVAQDNPYTLDAGGNITGDVRFSGTKTLLIKDSDGATVRTLDNVTCYEVGAVFGSWDEFVTYGSGGSNIVVGPDSKYYVSIAANNLGNTPASSPSEWAEFQLINVTAAQAALLEAIGALSPTDSSLIVGNGTTWVLETGATLRTSIGVGTGDTPQLTNVRLTGITTGHVVTGNSTGGLVGVDMTTAGLILAGDGTSAPSTVNVGAKGTLLVGKGSGVPAALAVGTNEQILIADSAQANGIKWGAVPVYADYQEFTSSDTWTKPGGVSFVYVEAVGAGGGGANNTTDIDTGGGAGGEYVSQVFQASALGASETVTIGAAGNGGANLGNNNGTAGGNTTFGAHLTANGGSPGTTVSGGAAPRGFASGPTAGAGGFATNGGNSIYGGAGGGGPDGGVGNTSGGTSQFGGNGGLGSATSTVAGGAGTAPGGGGGGSGQDGGGGNGAAGLVRVWSW